MRRAPIVLTGTVAGLAAVLSFHTASGRRTHGLASGPLPVSAASTAPGRSAAPGPASTGPANTGPASTGPASMGPATAGPPTRPSTAPSRTSAATRTAVGDDEGTQYGDVQVRVTMAAGRITDVTALVLPADQPRSQEISDQAAPILRSEALTAQSAQIDGVSGATYTSEGYQASLQSALDRLT